MGVTLALRALGLGDLLTALPALRALRAARPDDRLVLAAPGWLRPIVDLACCVDELHETPGLGRLHWTGPPPDLAVNLHGRGPQSIADLLATGATRLITHAHPDFPIPGPSWSPTAHEVRRWCDLLAGAGIPADPARLDLAPPPEGTPHAGAVVVHPGGSSAARRWPADRFAEVAAYLRGRADRVLVTGDAAERPLAESVAARAGLGPDAVLAANSTCVNSPPRWPARPWWSARTPASVTSRPPSARPRWCCSAPTRPPGGVRLRSAAATSRCGAGHIACATAFGGAPRASDCTPATMYAQYTIACGSRTVSASTHRRIRLTRSALSPAGGPSPAR
ncbi:Uncharacterised protein [Nocardia farcinica]|nr:Uncharacterised protein [Nocardia farcinica]